jgi:hypothetical protein
LTKRRSFLSKFIKAGLGATVLQFSEFGRSPTARITLAESSASEGVNFLNVEPRLEYEFLSPIAKGIGGGIGEYFYSIGKAGGNIVDGAGQGIGERLRDILSNAEGKRKLYPSSVTLRNQITVRSSDYALLK